MATCTLFVIFLQEFSDSIKRFQGDCDSAKLSQGISLLALLLLNMALISWYSRDGNMFTDKLKHFHSLCCLFLLTALGSSSKNLEYSVAEEGASKVMIVYLYVSFFTDLHFPLVKAMSLHLIDMPDRLLNFCHGVL